MEALRSSLRFSGASKRSGTASSHASRVPRVSSGRKSMLLSVPTASARTRRAQANPQPPRQSRGGHHGPEGEHDESHTLSVRPLSRHRGTALTHAPEEDKPFICAIPPLERPRGVQLIQRRALTEAPSVSFRNSPIFTPSVGVQLTPGDELTENRVKRGRTGL